MTSIDYEIFDDLAKQFLFGRANDALNVIGKKFEYRKNKSTDDIKAAIEKVRRSRTGKVEFEIDELSWQLGKILKAKKPVFYSCKLNRPETLKRHASFKVALKAAGDYGVVLDEIEDRVFQAFKMANGEIKGFDVIKRASQCSLFDFDIRAVVRATRET